MKLTLEQNNPNANVVRAYEPGKLIVGLNTFTRSFILSPGEIVDRWPPGSMDELTMDHVRMISALDADVLLIGTGSRQVFPRPDLMRDILAAGLTIEFMDTAAACRTYNILYSEDRQVAAGLMMI
ncbi:MAG: Mth938-like domain-containing protein [Gammaproteobacteria bacterium]